MGATYTRQSSGSIVDGSTIEATHFNNEFDQLLAAFASSTGHTHDGTSAEGGPITKLLGTAITIGDATSGTDIAVTFDGESNDGVLTWMEDEDYFKFSDDILVNSTEKLQFRDTAIYINSSTDGQLDLVADTEIQIAATTVDINGNVDVSGTLTVAGAVDFGDAALSNVGAVQLDSIAGDGDTNTSITFSGSDVITIATGGSGRLTIGDGALSPVTNNQIDLGTASLEFKDAYFDGTVTADAFAGPLTGNVTGNASGTAATVTGAAQSNITSLGTLTTLTVDNVIVNGTTIGHTDDTDLITLADGVATVAGEISVTTLDIGGTNVSSTAAELNYNDTGAAVGTVVASKTVTVDSNKDVASFRNITLTGELDAGSLDVSGDADIDGTLEADAITVDGTALATFIRDTVGTNMLSSNSESGITVTYDTTNDNIDFAVDAAQTGITSILATDVKIGEDDQTKIDFETADTINFYAGNEKQLILTDGALTPGTNAILDLGTDALEFKDAYFDGTVEADAITVGGTNISSIYSAIAGSSNIVTTGALNSGSITSGFGSIDTGSSTITTTGLISGGSLDIDNVLINGTTIGHTDDTDLITVADGLVTVAGEVQMTTLDIGGTNVTATATELNYSDLATLGTTAASKVLSADANNLTTISGAALFTEDTLSDGATVTWDVIASPVAKLTMGGNRTLSAPSGSTPAAGQFISLLLIQDGTGSRTITWNATYEFATDTAPTLTTTADKGDLFVFRYNGSKWLEVGRNLNLTLS
jgi:cytoskeletal protein CcmA (bactofilin family)